MLPQVSRSCPARMSDPPTMVSQVSKARTILACSECGQQLAQWAGRCPGCGAWGTIEATGPPGTAGSSGPSTPLETLHQGEQAHRRIPTGIAGIDRVLGGGLVPGSVVLLAGEPGIGKSTLLLQLIGRLAGAGLACLLASGEESRAQVADRAARLGLDGESLSFIAGRELSAVVDATLGAQPALLAVDSIQTLRDTEAATMPGGTSQVRGCADALVGLAKQTGTTVLLTGHVTKDGDLAGPRTLEHAVDVVLTFEGDPRSGQRLLAAGKNRFGREGEIAWFEMRADGLAEIDPADRLAPGGHEPGSAVALPLAGRRALAVEVQSLVVPTESSPRRQVAGLDPRRFQLVAAVVERAAGIPLSRADLYGAASGGMRIDDPACDLALAAALASAATGLRPPEGTAFAGEISLTGMVRPGPGMPQRAAAAAALGLTNVVSGPGGGDGDLPAERASITAVHTVREALAWASSTQPAA